MRNHSILNILTLLLLAFVIVSSVKQSTAEETKTDITTFKKTAMKKWKEEFDAADNYECTKVIRRVEDGKVVSEEKSRVDIQFPCNLQEIGINDNTNSTNVECNNSKYGFSLYREEDSTDWKIGFIHKNDSNLRRKKRLVHEESCFILCSGRQTGQTL